MNRLQYEFDGLDLETGHIYPMDTTETVVFPAGSDTNVPPLLVVQLWAYNSEPSAFQLTEITKTSHRRYCQRLGWYQVDLMTA